MLTCCIVNASASWELGSINLTSAPYRFSCCFLVGLRLGLKPRVDVYRWQLAVTCSNRPSLGRLYVTGGHNLIKASRSIKEKTSLPSADAHVLCLILFGIIYEAASSIVRSYGPLCKTPHQGHSPEITSSSIVMSMHWVKWADPFSLGQGGCKPTMSASFRPI